MSADSARALPSIAPSSVSAGEAGQAHLPTPQWVIPTPPRASIRPRVDRTHADIRVDEYAWLRDRDDPAVVAYLEAENRYTDAVMQPTERLQERLFEEMRARIKETDLSVPEPLDDWLYYSRTEAGSQYPIHCRRRAGEGSPEEVLLDLNPLAEGQSYFRLGAFDVSPDHRLLAWSSDTSGAESFSLRIKDLTTGEELTEQIGNVSASVAWANDSATLFYVVLDAARRPCRLCRHRLGDDPSRDALVYFEPDEAFFLDVTRTRSQAYLLMELSSHSTSEVRFLRADRPEDAFEVVVPRRAGIEYSVGHHADRFYITTNDDAPNFRLVSSPVSDRSKAAWTPVLPYRPMVRVDGTDIFRNHLVVYEREAGLRRVRILDLATGNDYLIPFPEPVYSIRAHENPEFDTTILRFTYTSMVTPNSVVEYDMAARSWTVRKQTEVLGGYDPARYRSERRFATTPDGTRIPISLVYREPLERNGSRPLWLNGYGAYGISFDPSFSSNSLTLLDRGFVVAIAHVRGGEEMGRDWYEHGKLKHKCNSFSDFIAAAEHLVAEGYTAPDRLVINGGSAGGLLMGAVTNMRPDLFAAVVAEVPFVDVVNTMLDATLPLTVIEYDEWGNPNDPEAYACIRAYSPYDNVATKRYPHMLVTAGLHDPRVAYWEPAKWVARLRARKTDRNRLLLRTNMAAGHGGASGRWDYLREVAFKYAFVLDVLGSAA
ncbi:MAG: S9 family peptidase [Gemmatimonadales bacterium]